MADAIAGEQFVYGGQPAALGPIEDQERQARYPDDAAPVVEVDDGQLVTADLLGRDLPVCPLRDREEGCR